MSDEAIFVGVGFVDGADRRLGLPKKSTLGSSGFDLKANLLREVNPDHRSILIPARGRAMVPTGLVLEIPAGFEGQIRPRSGLALRDGITVLNAPGTIDSDYRGEVGVILANLGSDTFTVEHGDRVAQIVFQTLPKTSVGIVEQISQSERGKNGFGSSGDR